MLTIKTADNIAIAVEHYCLGHERLVIIAPGFYNSKDALLMKDLAQALSVSDDVMAMDFRGHGQSEGLFCWTSKEYLDLLAVVEYASSKYAWIGVVGFSLGAATALISAHKSKHIKSIVAVSPPSEFERIEYRVWELDFDHDIQYSILGEGRIGKGVRPGPWWLEKEKPIDAVKLMDQPVLFIHGTADWLIKPWHSKHLYDHTPSPKRLEIILDAPHAEYIMRTHKDKLVGLIKDWFKS